MVSSGESWVGLDVDKKIGRHEEQRVFFLGLLMFRDVEIRQPRRKTRKFFGVPLPAATILLRCCETGEV